MIDAKTFGLELAGIVKAQLGPIVSRLDALEKRFDQLPAPRDGKDADMVEVRQIVGKEISGLKAIIDAMGPDQKQLDTAAMINEAINARLLEEMTRNIETAARLAVSELPLPKDGTSVAIDDVMPAIERQVTEFLTALPKPQDGKSVTIEDIAPVIASEVDRRVGELPKPKDGKDGASVTIDDVMPAIERQVTEFLTALPQPQDGKSVTIEDIAPVIASEVDRRVGELPKPKDGKDGRDGIDGIGLAGAFIDRAGELVVTLSNGEAHKLGPVVGKDGDPGNPGRDGFNLQDFDATVMDDGRTVLLAFDRGDLSYKIELGFAVMLYRGVYKDGREYEQGDTVTWAGSLWHCDGKTTERPGEGSSPWTLCVKKGRDGKDGTVSDAKAAASIRVGVPAEGK